MCKPGSLLQVICPNLTLTVTYLPCLPLFLCLTLPHTWGSLVLVICPQNMNSLRTGVWSASRSRIVPRTWNEVGSRCMHSKYLVSGWVRRSQAELSGESAKEGKEAGKPSGQGWRCSAVGREKASGL